MTGQVRVGEGEMPHYTQEDFEHAAEDARHLMSNSVIIPKLVAVDIYARQLFLHVHSAMVQEINRGWDVEYPELVVQTLGMSAQESAVNNPISALEMHQRMFEGVIPILEIFMEMEQDVAAAAATSSPTPILGDNDEGQGELGHLPDGGEGNTEQQTRERGEGDQGEAGEAPA